jgi:hypothetical protein
MAFLIPGFPNELPINAIGIPYYSNDAISLPAQAVSATWGIYQGGSPVLSTEGIGTSVASFTYKQDWLLSDYPIEDGGFESYDKVLVPFDVRLRFVVTGSSSAIASFLNTLQQIADPAQQGLQLYDVYMPEITYPSCSVQHYDYTRTVENGGGILIVDVWLLQIRIGNSGESNTQQPSGADSVNTGSVQPQPVTPVQSSQLPDVT